MPPPKISKNTPSNEDKEAQELLEKCNIETFMKYFEEHRRDININIQFPTERKITYPILLAQAYRKLDQPNGPVVDDILFTECLQFLIRHGANLNICDDDKRSVAHWCVMMKIYTLLRDVLKCGCDPLLQDNEGQTIVHLAIRLKCLRSLEIIHQSTSSEQVFEEPSVCSGATPLIYAAQIGELEVIKKLCYMNVVNVNLQEKNKYKRTALHYALFTNRADIFEILLKNGASMNIPDYANKTVVDRLENCTNDQFIQLTDWYSQREEFKKTDTIAHGITPLMDACQNDDYQKVQKLLEDVSTDTEATDEDNRTALHLCAEHKETRCAALLLSKNHNLINQADRKGFTTLHLATVAGNTELMSLLIKKNADINCKDEEGHTCLHWAVVCCQIEAVNLLLKNKANPSIADKLGAYPLHYATQAFMTKDGDVFGPTLLDSLLAHTKTIDCEDSDKRTPLLWAASLGAEECCRMLMSKNANVSHADNDGLTALHCAASKGQHLVIKLLLTDKKVNIDWTDKNGCTALFYAVTLKQTEIVKLLLEEKCNVNHQDSRGRTVMHCAAVKGHSDLIKVLKVSGGNLWTKNDRGSFPLHEACEIGKLDVAKSILDNSTQEEIAQSINEYNNQGYTCLHLAAMNGNTELCDILLVNGAKINALSHCKSRRQRNKTAVDLASTDDCRDMLEFKGAETGEKVIKVEGEYKTDAQSDKDSDDEVIEPESLSKDVANTSTLEAVVSPNLLLPQESIDESGSRETPNRKISTGSQAKSIGSAPRTHKISTSESIVKSDSPKKSAPTSPKKSPEKSSPSKLSSKSDKNMGNAKSAQDNKTISKQQEIKSKMQKKESKSSLINNESPTKSASQLSPVKSSLISPQLVPESLNESPKRHSEIPVVFIETEDEDTYNANGFESPQHGSKRASQVEYNAKDQKGSPRTQSKSKSAERSSRFPPIKSQSQRPVNGSRGGSVNPSPRQIKNQHNRSQYSSGQHSSSSSLYNSQYRNYLSSSATSLDQPSTKTKNKNNSIAQRIAESVHHFETVRSTMREMAKIKRSQALNGHISDKALLDSLRLEYQRNYFYQQEKGNSSTTGTSRSSETSSVTTESSRTTASDYSKGTKGLSTKNLDDDLEKKLRETRKLYEDVQFEADKTLREARRVNNELCDDLQKKRIAVYINNVNANRTVTSKHPQHRPLNAVMTSTIRQNRIQKAYHSPMGSTVSSSSSNSSPTNTKSKHLKAQNGNKT